MQNTKRRVALASVLSLLLYLGPNLVQDVHRMVGHQIHFGEFHNQNGLQLSLQKEVCSVCVFEFNIVESGKTFAFVPVIHIEPFILETITENQIHKIFFSYHNLRGPPQA